MVLVVAMQGEQEEVMVEVLVEGMLPQEDIAKDPLLPTSRTSTFNIS